jgi:hypothetical protein
MFGRPVPRQENDIKINLKEIVWGSVKVTELNENESK